MGFKSADCAGQDISWKTCCSSLHLMYRAQFTSILWVIILHEYWSLSHKPRSITEPPLCFTVGVIEGVSVFHQLFATHRPSYLTERFRTLIRQSKGLYSSAVFFSLCASWPSGGFWHCFTSSIVVFWQQFCHMGQIHSLLLIVYVDSFFHDISSVVLWCLEHSAFCHANWWFRWNSPLLLLLLLVLFCPVS